MPLSVYLTPRYWVQVFTLLALPVAGVAAGSSPASKVFFSDVRGPARIDTGDKIHDLARRGVYNAEGSIIETEAAPAEAANGQSYSTMVYSNGTGAFFDPETRLELKRFVQEPFTPTRSDFDVEPSISQTQAFLARGTVGLCTSKLVAGSSMVYQTAHAAVTVIGRKVVIEAGAAQTKISMIEGESTVRAGAMDTGGHTIRAGEQALITRGPAGKPNGIQIGPIPPSELPALNDKVSLACMAKRTVYFEVREAPGSSDGTPPSDSTAATSDAEATSRTSGGGNSAFGVVRAFYGNTAAPNSARAREIVATPVVPANLPVPFVVSPANLPAPGR